MIQIRDAREDDLEPVVGLWEELVEHHRRLSKYYTLSADSKEKWSKYLAKKFSEKSTKLIVASDDGQEVIGFMLCLLQPNPAIFGEKTAGLISDVYVRPERRRKGIMKEMLKLALEWFKKNRCKSVTLTVAAQNIEARAIWKQLGFEPHMVHKRLDLEGRKANRLLKERPKRARKKIVRRTKRNE